MPAVIIRGDDPAHATRARIICASFCLKAEFWPVMLPDQTPDRVRERIVEFGRADRA